MTDEPLFPYPAADTLRTPDPDPYLPQGDPNSVRSAQNAAIGVAIVGV